MSKPPQTNQHSQPCSRQRADQFLNSDDYRLEDAELIAHLDTCDQCCEYIDSQAATPEVWSNLSTLLKPGEFDEAGVPEFSAATIGHIGQKPVAAQDVLDALTPTDDPHKLGRLGNYEVTGIVGVGGMGVVLKAIDPSLDRVVAIKVIAPQLANNENARKRFAREAKAAAAVLHPNVIPIHSVSSSASLPYLVMSYVRGGSLQKRLEQEGPLPVVEVLRIGSQIAAGLAAAHDQGLVHRDIKPENILLEEGVERVTITDFGLARAVDDNAITQNGTIAGTPMYMSPEQARGDQVDQQSDLFSLGSVLYAISTGQPPYRCDSSYGVMRKIIDNSPAPIREVNPDVPAWLVSIIERLMSKQKSDRFASAAEVRELLENCLSHVQQPDAIALPAIPGSCRKQRMRPYLKTVKGILTIITLVPATAVALIFCLQMGGLLTPEKHDPNQLPRAIEKFADLPITEINTDLAERLIGHDEHLTFTKLATLDPEAAAILAKHPSNLSFPALQQLSPEVAKALAVKDHLWLNLSGLKQISPEVARELGEAKCALSLDSVESITPEVAAALVRGNGTLRVGLTSITPEVADALSKHSGWLTLHNIRTLDSKSAEALARHKHWLSLDGLSSLTPQIAEALGHFNGTNLDLKYVKTLDEECAQRLSNATCRGGLYLNSLTTITADVADALSHGTYLLSLQGLDKNQMDAKTLQGIEAAQKKVFDRLKALLDAEHSRKTAIGEKDGVNVPELSDSASMNQIAELLDAWKNLPDQAGESGDFEKKFSNLHNELRRQQTPNTESRQQTSESLALLSWSHLSDAIPKPMAQRLADLTKPDAGIRLSDRLAEAGRPTEPLGWDVQSTHALALARAGKIEEALKENEALLKKIDINVRKGRLPDLRLEFFGTTRSQKSVLMQTLLQKSLILAIAGRTAESVDASNAAGHVEVENPTKDDQSAIQAMIQTLAKAIEPHGAEATNAEVPGHAPVNETNIVDLTFNHYFTPDKKSHAADFEWTFTKKEFVLKKGTGAIPADLLEKMLPKGSTADEIRGKWRLANTEGQQLVLTEIKAGDTSGNEEVSLFIYKTAPTVVRIGELQYVFGIGK